MGSIGERERLRGIVKRFFGGFLSLFLFFSFYSGLIFFSLKFFLRFLSRENFQGGKVMGRITGSNSKPVENHWL